MFFEKLKELIYSKEIVSLYTSYNDTSRFVSGIILDISETEILISSIAPNGAYDGFMVLCLENIYRINQNSNYELKLLKLYQRCKENYKVIDCMKEDIKKTLLEYALSNELIVSIELFNSNCDDVQGIVKNIDNNVLSIESIDEYGNKDGLSTINIEDITSIVCDSDKEQILKMLVDKR